MNEETPIQGGFQTDPFEVQDFSGGVTDYYIGGAANKYKRCDNLLIVPHGDVGKLFTRQGSQIYDQSYYQIPAGNQRISTLKVFEDTLLVQSKEKFQYVSGGWQTIQGPSGNNVFPSTASTDDVISSAVWNRHLLVATSAYSKPQKIFPNASNVLTLRTAGLPQPSAPTCAGTAGTTFNYLYAFVFDYTYTVGTLTFEDVSTPVQVTCQTASAPNSSAIAITNIPVLANGSTDNYDTASSNLKVKIYRTADAGTTFYYVGSVNNGTTTFSDSVSDNTITTNNQILYTTGGVVNNDAPPLCKLVHVATGGAVAYYANIKVGTQIYSNRIMQSVPGDIDSVPTLFYCDIDDEIVGLSSVKGAPITLCKNGSVYRFDGSFDLLGRGGLFPQKISDRANCVSSQSVVQTIEGVFWAGDDGIFFTNGYDVLRLNEDFDKTWATWVSNSTQKARIQGKYDSKHRRIWWTIQSTVGSTDVDTGYVLDLNWGIKPKAAFTTVSGTNNSFLPTAIDFSGAQMYRADRRGYLFTHMDGLYTDPKVDIATTPANWQTTLLKYDHISCAYNFGTSQMRKFIPRVNITCHNETNLSLEIISINDVNVASYNLKPVRFRGNMVWGDADVIWEDSTLDWNREGLIDEWRRFPGAALRCEYKQIQLTNAYVAITSSDLLGTATVDAGVAKTVTLASGAWPSVVIDYYIAFSGDGYTKEFLVTSRTSDTVLTISDPTNAATNAVGTQWVIRGYPKGEVMNLISYVLHYAVFGKSQKTYRKALTGEVGASSL